MKVQDIIPMIVYNNQMKPYKPTWFSYTKYRSENSKKAGVTRWSYGADKRANDGQPVHSD